MRSIATNEERVAELAGDLVQRIAAFPSVVVAFSGGVDSAVVAKAASLACGDAAYALTGTGPALGQSEYESAVETAGSIGIALHSVDPHELDVAGYVANSGRRCYFCKTSLYQAAQSFAAKRGIAVVLNGTNADDFADYRPGLQAADEFGVVSPLADLGIDKGLVRRIAGYWNLSVAEKPASPCLASRIAPGVEVTAERLAKVEAAETFVRDCLGLTEIRVRIESGELARIEIPNDGLKTAVPMLLDDDVVAKFTTLGFRAVTLDLQGFRSGNLNSLINLEPDLAKFADGNRKAERAVETR